MATRRRTEEPIQQYEASRVLLRALYTNKRVSGRTSTTKQCRQPEQARRSETHLTAMVGGRRPWLVYNKRLYRQCHHPVIMPVHSQTAPESFTIGSSMCPAACASSSLANAHNVSHVHTKFPKVNQRSLTRTLAGLTKASRRGQTWPRS